MIKFLFIISLLISSCGAVAPKSNTVRSLQLEKKADLYLEQMHRDEHGFIMTDHCDATLFSGLLGAATKDVALRAAASEDLKQWYRRPNKDCSPSLGNSRSTVSRDMILGAMWWMWKNKDLQAAETLLRDLKSRAYYLRGEGTPGELLMNTSMMSTLAHIVLRLGGPRYELELALPVIFGKDTGFIAHLTVWHILLRGELNGTITSNQFGILQHHARRNPLNPLYQAAYYKYFSGDQSVAIRLLLDNAEWPADRLPTTEQHCEPWPVMRDYTEKDWGSCSPFKEHTGAELIAIYRLIILSE